MDTIAYFSPSPLLAKDEPICVCNIVTTLGRKAVLAGGLE